MSFKAKMVQNHIYKTVELSEDILNGINIEKELRDDLERGMVMNKSAGQTNRSNMAKNKIGQIYKFWTKSKPNVKQSERLKLIVTFLVGFLVSQTLCVVTSIQHHEILESSLIAKYQKLLSIWIGLSFCIYIWTVYAIWHRRVSRFKHLVCTYAFHFILKILFSALYTTHLLAVVLSKTQSIQLVLLFAFYISVDLVCFVFTYLLTKSYPFNKENSFF
jgi:hypothetical protein